MIKLAFYCLWPLCSGREHSKHIWLFKLTSLWAELWTFMGSRGILLCLLNHVGWIRVLTSPAPPPPALLRSAVLPGWAKNPRNVFISYLFWKRNYKSEWKKNKWCISFQSHSKTTRTDVLVDANGFFFFFLHFERIYMAKKSLT